MKSYVGWALLFAYVTCLQEYIRWDLFVLRAQPLDTSPLSLCWHNKTLLPAKLPQYPMSQIESPSTFLGGLLPGLWRWWFVTFLIARVHPLDSQEKILTGTNGQFNPEGDFSSWRVGVKVLDAQWNPVRHRTQWGMDSTAHHTGNNPS
jgi:hypothetical protein